MNLESYRQKKGFTYQQLADKLGMDMSYVHKICKGLKMPSFKVARLIVTETKGKVKYDDFWEHTESKKY